MWKKTFTTASMVKIGLLSALAYILMYFDFAIPFLFPGFLKMDFSDVPALVAGFALGPIAGIFVELIKNLLYLVTKSSTGGVGSAANFVTGVALVVPASMIYYKMRNRTGALIGMLTGTLVMTLTMAITNFYVFIPLYEIVLGFPMTAIVAMGTEVNSNITDLKSLVILGITPFNLMKGIAVSLVTFVIYKHIARVFKRI
jgi:riboflavin transporter FmnP